MQKVIIVTGASSGIGKATALQLIKEGHTVYGVARRVEKMSELVSSGGKTIAMDLTNHEQVHTEIQKIIKKEGGVDVLVNNAGYAVYGAVEEVSYEKAREQFEVNLFGLAEATKAVLPAMRKQKSGTIVNVSSIGGRVYGPLAAWYHATKFGLEGWSHALRLEVDQFGIDVVIIEPGVIKTGFTEAMDHKLGDDNNSTYKDLEKVVINMVKNTNKPKQYSEPSVIANTISKAIQSKKPKTIYVAGKMAKPTIMMRKLLSDRGFDKLFLRMVKSYGKQ